MMGDTAWFSRSNDGTIGRKNVERVNDRFCVSAIHKSRVLIVPMYAASRSEYLGSNV